MSLTDTQLVILSKAAQREDRAVELPAKLRGGVARKVVEKLVTAGLLEEVQARGALPAWRRDENDIPMALRITKRGMKAIRVDDGEEASEATRSAPTASPAKATKTKRPAAEKAAARPARSAVGTRSDRKGEGGSKQETVLAMLRAQSGTTIAAVGKATGWQPHSVRGFFAGVVRKRLGLNLVSEKEGDERIYRIVEEAAAGKRTYARAAA